MKINYKSFIICMIGLSLGKLLNRSMGDSDMLLVVMGTVCILLAVYYYWKKQHQECIVLMLTFAIACFIPVTVGQYSDDVYYLSSIGSIFVMMMGLNAFVVMQSRREQNVGKKKFMRIVVGVNTLVMLCFCAIGLYVF
ncbi:MULTISPECIES: hypothetical protein [Selenomonas]|uniref:Uncharacterized protein n=1 Tax=Selenomonas ruminantium TaxID=971 RepID=A0A1I0WKF1_SELRU|nr:MULTISPECIES: hypothetical protein [Selenomonas]SFA89219.1 hypothetical protein SAMN05216587_10375 [Selenomonas ruminantium]